MCNLALKIWCSEKKKFKCGFMKCKDGIIISKIWKFANTI